MTANPVPCRDDHLSPEAIAAIRQIPQQPPSTASRAEQMRVLHAIALRLGMDVASQDVGREILVWLFVPEEYADGPKLPLPETTEVHP